jgi:hypothetical protein
MDEIMKIIATVIDIFLIMIGFLIAYREFIKIPDKPKNNEDSAKGMNKIDDSR